MRPLGLRWLSLLLIWLLVASSELHAAGAQPLTEFLRLKDQWPDLVGSSFRLEGHYTIATKNYVKLKNCDLKFRSTKPLEKLRGVSKVIEISGRLAKDGEGLFFEIDSLRELPSDLQTMQQKESTLARAVSKEWYELAAWANDRGKFYDDEELLKRATTLKHKGLHLERQEIKVLTPAALRTLAARVKELELEDALHLELLHEALCVEWEEARKSATKIDLEADTLDTKKDPLFVLLSRVDSELPAATTVAKDVLPLLVTEYRKSPISSYHSASPTSRQVMHRLLHVEVATAAIARWTNPKGSNGEAIAALIDQWLPEQHDKAEEHRDLELAFLANDSATLSRSQLNDLIQRCRDRKQDALVKEAISRWLTRREQSLRKDGVTGLIQLSDDYLSLTQDVIKSASFLLEALQLAPKNEDILDRLKKFGFQEIDGKWRLPQGATQTPDSTPPGTVETDLERNIRLGVPMVGMTPAQLLKCLGAPQSVTRVATSGRITESWIYREGVITRHSITIDRRPSRGTASVTSVQ